GPGSHLRLIEPPKAADRERDTALCLRLSLHDGVSEGVALEPGDAHGSDCLVCAPLRITSACRDDVDIVAVHLAPGDLHADAVDLAELIGSVSLGVEGEFAVEGDVLERLRERI